MKVSLVHNPKAGLSAHEESDLLDAIRAEGHQVERAQAKAVPHCDLIAVAGGDGTVEKVIRHGSGQGLPLVIIPLGTANNIARSLGVEMLSPADWPQLFRNPRPHQMLSAGRITGPNLERLFVESVGCGLVTSLIKTGKTDTPNPADELRFRVEILHRILQHAEPRPYELVVDGRDRSGSYLLVEIMNIACVGPGLELARDKDPADARLAVVTVTLEEKHQLEHYLNQLARGEKATSPFRYQLARQVDLGCRAHELHVDDKCLQGESETRFTVKGGVRQISIFN